MPLLPEVTCGFIGRFERLDDDFREVCRRLGIAEHGLPRRNAGPQEPDDRKLHWSERYEAATIRLVEELYREDMDAFGYAPPVDTRTPA